MNSWVPGTRVGPYEVSSLIGAGGMGRVYLARDTRLDRQVAIKVLAPDLAEPSARRRLEREGQAIAGLSHPYICTLHDIGEHNEAVFLVMEYLEGETLARRLQQGPLPIDQALAVATQIAEALAAAHGRGVVHRDLKPANVMLTRTGVKLLDFGLAKLTGQPEMPVASELMSAETRSAPLTAQGTIVGTLQYMAPEQIEGRAIDHRVDVWALGAVVYEMLAGSPPFRATTPAQLIADILSSTPVTLATRRPETPPALQRLVTTCLVRDPDARWRCAHDLAAQLRWILEGVDGPPADRPSSGSRSRRRLAWAAGAVALGLLATTAAWNRTPEAPAMYFRASLPFAADDVALAPDGQRLALVAYSAQANTHVLWTHELGSTRTDPVAGTDGASYPFWSPDGTQIGFFADGKLKKVAVAGGAPQILSEAPNGRGGSWSRDNIILFTPDAIGKGVFRVSSLGGPSVEVTTTDTTLAEQSHRWPTFLPNGRHFLYFAANFSGRSDTNAVYVAALDSTERRRVEGVEGNVVYSEPGYLVFMRDATLVAQRFDIASASLTGDAQTLSDRVLHLPAVDRAVFSVAGGVLVAQTGEGASLSRLMWFDRAGRATGSVGGAELYNNVRLAPDGRRVAADQTDPNGRNVDIWIYDPARDTKTRLTFDGGLNQIPTWSPDGRQIVYISNRTLGFDLFRKNADASGSEELFASLGTMVQVGVWDWSRDGQHVLVRRGNELWYVTDNERTAKPLIQGEYAIRNAQFSPDGRWIAYASNETGSSEVYVSTFPRGEGKWQISVAGGREPKWRDDGRELYYLSRDGRMMAVALEDAAGALAARSPVPLFQTRSRQPVSAGDVFSYDVSADGQRFLVIAKGNEKRSAPLEVLLNWDRMLARTP